MRKTILLGVVALAIVATACTIDTGAQRSTSSPAVGNAFGTQTLAHDGRAGRDRREPGAARRRERHERHRPPPFGKCSRVRASAPGFIVRSDGVVVTNCHVVEGGTKITVFTSAQKPDAVRRPGDRRRL